LCIIDRREAERLENRRRIIREQIIPAMRSFTIPISDPKDVVWVELTPFLQFMSCSDRASPRLNDFRTNIRRCDHDSHGLHPRVARRGKLIPRIACDVYFDTLIAEQESLKPEESHFERPVALAMDEIVCQECAQEYRSELKGKLSRVKALKLLYEELCPKEFTFSLQMGPNEAENVGEDNKFAYAVSRKFVTWLRTRFVQLMKKAAVALSEASAMPIDAHELQAENIAEGLDAFDLQEFDANYCGLAHDDELDVNRNITCKCTFLFDSPTSVPI
jgi:hypothetical protein